MLDKSICFRLQVLLVTSQLRLEDAKRRYEEEMTKKCGSMSGTVHERRMELVFEWRAQRIIVHSCKLVLTTAQLNYCH